LLHLLFHETHFPSAILSISNLAGKEGERLKEEVSVKEVSVELSLLSHSFPLLVMLLSLSLSL
jgi:hypothetical protein